MTREQQIEHLKAALQETIAWRLRYEKEAPDWHRGADRSLKTINLAAWANKPIPPRGHWPTGPSGAENETTFNHAVLWGYRQAHRAYGEALYAIGGTDLMERIGWEIAADLEDDRAFEILAHAWDSIGCDVTDGRGDVWAS